MLITARSLSSFCEAAKKQFEGVANVEIKVHDLKWAEEHKMGSFISVSRGSDEPLRFLELTYHGAANKDEGEWRSAPLQMGCFLTPSLPAAPLAFVGKGITFDSGGIVSEAGRPVLSSRRP